MIPILKKINPGVNVKSGEIVDSKSCSCKDPSLFVRKKFITTEAWDDKFADPTTEEFRNFKMDIESKVLMFILLMFKTP